MLGRDAFTISSLMRGETKLLPFTLECMNKGLSADWSTAALWSAFIVLFKKDWEFTRS